MPVAMARSVIFWFPSLTFAQGAADQLNQAGRSNYIYVAKSIPGKGFVVIPGRKRGAALDESAEEVGASMGRTLDGMIALAKRLPIAGRDRLIKALGGYTKQDVEAAISRTRSMANRETTGPRSVSKG